MGRVQEHLSRTAMNICIRIKNRITISIPFFNMHNIYYSVFVVSQGTAPATDAQQFQHHTAVAGWETHQRHQMAVGLVQAVYGEQKNDTNVLVLSYLISHIVSAPHGY
jgi:hypothetical protein